MRVGVGMGTLVFKIFRVIRDNERLWKCFRLKETERAQQLNTLLEPKLNPILGESEVLKRTLLDQLTKLEYGCQV